MKLQTESEIFVSPFFAVLVFFQVCVEGLKGIGENPELFLYKI